MSKSTKSIFITALLTIPVVLLELQLKTLREIPKTCRALFFDFFTSEFVIHWMSLIIVAWPMFTLTFLKIGISKFVLITRKQLIQHHVHAVIYYICSQLISVTFALLIILVSSFNNYKLCILTFSKTIADERIVYNIFILCTMFITSSLYFSGDVYLELMTLNQRVGGELFSINYLEKRVILKFIIYTIAHVIPNLILYMILICKTKEMLVYFSKTIGIIFYCNLVSSATVFGVLTVSWKTGGRITKRRRSVSTVSPRPRTQIQTNDK
ncbi:hypothetical protein GVAV_001424 [Gurleya vavrai]